MFGKVKTSKINSKKKNTIFFYQHKYIVQILGHLTPAGGRVCSECRLCDGGMSDILYWNHQHASLFAACKMWRDINTGAPVIEYAWILLHTERITQSYYCEYFWIFSCFLMVFKCSLVKTTHLGWYIEFGHCIISAVTMKLYAGWLSFIKLKII